MFTNIFIILTWLGTQIIEYSFTNFPARKASFLTFSKSNFLLLSVTTFPTVSRPDSFGNSKSTRTRGRKHSNRYFRVFVHH